MVFSKHILFSSMVAETVNAADPAAKESYELAKKYNITPPEVDKIRKKFVEFLFNALKDQFGTI